MILKVELIYDRLSSQQFLKIPSSIHLLDNLMLYEAYWSVKSPLRIPNFQLLMFLMLLVEH